MVVASSLLPLAYIVWYLGTLGYAHVSGPGSWGSSFLFIDSTCCSGLHVGVGFASWILWPLYVASIYYQTRDLSGENGVHGAEPLRQTLGDMLEYTVGVFMCLIAARVEPLHFGIAICRPARGAGGGDYFKSVRDEVVAKMKQLVWKGFEVPDEYLSYSRMTQRTKGRQQGLLPLASSSVSAILSSVLHLLLLVLFLTYLSLSLQELDLDSPISKQISISCCSSTHVLLGFFIWFCPPLSVVFLALHLSNGEKYLNVEGTQRWGVLAEYMLGTAMCSVANRALPLLTNCRREEQWWRLKMLFYPQAFIKEKGTL